MNEEMLRELEKINQLSLTQEEHGIVSEFFVFLAAVKGDPH